LAQIG